MKLPLIDKKNFFSKLTKHESPWQNAYLAMYSSQWQGISTDPGLMLLPIDDHLVHRGDGVFEVIRCVGDKVYMMEAHLQRLERSARAVSLKLPPEYEHIRDIIKSLIAAGGEKECIIRVTISRGPGGFSVNPFECPASQIYPIVIRYHPLPEPCYTDGVTLITSRIPIKKSFFANVKSCNYLPNVLMKMEAIEAGCQYAVALDEAGFIAESATENFGMVSQEGVLLFPDFERTLAGITANRGFELAGALVKQNKIKAVGFSKIRPDDAYQAREVFLTGTSINVLPVVQYDGKPIGKGIPGPVYADLSALLWEDMNKNPDVLTDID